MNTNGHTNGDYFGFTLVSNNTDGTPYTGRRVWSERATQNVLTSRIEAIQQLLMDRRRNLEDECGYPRLDESINVEIFRQLYDRDSIANRVVSVLPKESWQVQPLVYEREEGDEQTPFEKAWDELGTQLTQDGSSYYKQEEGSPIWEYLCLADILSGIGHFGILLLGIDDGKNLMEPVDGVEVVVNARVRSVRRKGRNRAIYNQEFKRALPDAWLPEEDEKRLLDNTYFDRPGRDRDGNPTTMKALPLTNSERAAIHAWRKEREGYQRFIANAAQKKGKQGIQGVDRGMSADPTEPTFQPAKSADGKEVYGTDTEYDGTHEGMGMPPAALSGTDQQYFGVQFGPSEAMGDSPSASKHKLLFLRAFDESLVQIVRWEWNIRNPRFGQPVMYRVTLNDPRVQHSGVGLPMATVFVHWSRVLHLCDTNLNAVSSRVAAMPRMQPSLNNLLGLRKLYMSGPEGYYRSCISLLKFITHESLGGDVNVDMGEVQDTYEQALNGMQRVLTGKGGDWNYITPNVVDPAPHIDKQLEAICIQLGIPVRVFKGSERGELASSQDDASWNDRLKQRQQHYITPRIIVPFIDRLIGIGVLPKPNAKPSGPSQAASPEASPEAMPEDTEDTDDQGTEEEAPTGNRLDARGVYHGVGNAEATDGDAEATDSDPETEGPVAPGKGEETPEADEDEEPGYCIEWPDLDSMTDKDKAGVLFQRTQAYAAYVAGNLESLIPPHEYMTKFDNLTEEESQSIIEGAKQAHEDMDTMTAPPMIQGQPAAAADGTQAKEDQKAQQEQAKQEMKMQQQALKQKGAAKPFGGGAGAGKPPGMPGAGGSPKPGKPGGFGK